MGSKKEVRIIEILSERNKSMKVQDFIDMLRMLSEYDRKTSEIYFTTDKGKKVHSVESMQYFPYKNHIDIGLEKIEV